MKKKGLKPENIAKKKQSQIASLINTIICGDNLDVLRAIDSECVDLVYLDPLFNKNRKMGSPIEKYNMDCTFKDVFEDKDMKDEWVEFIDDKHPTLAKILNAYRDVGHPSNYYYCVWLVIRLLEVYRVLKPTGSLYLHCDQTMNNHIELMLQYVFGEENCRNEIVWRRNSSSKSASRAFGNNSDYIYYFTKSDKYVYNPQYKAYSDDYIRKNFKNSDKRGFYNSVTLANQQPNGYKYEYKGYAHPKNGWYCPEKTMKKLDKEDRLIFPAAKTGRIRQKRYLDEGKGVLIDNLWDDIKNVNARSKEFQDYKTQKPLALLERIIKTSSKEGDVVLDAFAGCSTACVAAARLNRSFIGIDISLNAFDIMQNRMKEEVDFFLEVKFINTNKKEKLPPRTTIDKHKQEKFTREQIKGILAKKQMGKRDPKCNGCKLEIRLQWAEIDHIHPVSKGGADEISNMQLLCPQCNRSKGNMSMENFLAKLKMKKNKIH